MQSPPFAAFGIGPTELIILVLVGGLLVLPLVMGGVVLFIVLMRQRSGTTAWKPSETTGPPMQIRLLNSADTPISDSARWTGDELQISSDKTETKKLFEVPLKNLDQCVITYRFRIKTDNLGSYVYPEMWCRVVGQGEFFSRGLNCKIRGTNDWKVAEIPFYLQTGQHADQLNLNLVFEGLGAVKLKDIEILATPTKATA